MGKRLAGNIHTGTTRSADWPFNQLGLSISVIQTTKDTPLRDLEEWCKHWCSFQNSKNDRAKRLLDLSQEYQLVSEHQLVESNLTHASMMSHNTKSLVT